MTSLKGFEPYVDDMVNRFVQVCNDHANAQTPINLSLWCHYCEYVTAEEIGTLTVKTASMSYQR